MLVVSEIDSTFFLLLSRSCSSSLLPTLSVRVAEEITLSVQELLQSNARSNVAKIDLEIKCKLHSTVIEWSDGAANLVKTPCKVLLLPGPQDTVEVAVMQVEERICTILSQMQGARCRR